MNKHTIIQYLLVLASALLFPQHGAGQSADQNYIIESTFTSYGGSGHVETVSYFDGLGRPKETVQKGTLIIGGSQDGDAVSLMTYDACGRPLRKYLPVGVWGNDGDYIGETVLSSRAATQYSDSSPYSEMVYDGSPLDRVKIEWGAGVSWRMQGRGIYHSRFLNDEEVSSLSLISFTAGYSGNMEPIIWKGFPVYADGTIRVEESTDEDGRKVSTFTDAFGQVILERRFLANYSYSDTYYGYDDAGRLIAVLPPELSSRLANASGTAFTLGSSDLLQKYGYFYRYDDKGQLIAKKLPGADWNYYIYDKGGRLVYSQDGNQRLRGEWSFTLSDRIGRECLRGTVERSLSPFTDPLGDVHVFVLRNEPATDMRDYGYLAVNFDLHDTDVLHVNWYDDYSFLGNMDGIPSAASTTSPTRFDAMAITDCGDEMYEYSGAGQMTGSLDKVLGETDGNLYLWEVMYYDKKGRVVQDSRSTHRGGWDRTNTGYDFTGHPLSARIIHHDATAGDMTERYSYTYDAWGRPLTVTHRLDNLPAVTLHNYSYDAIGRVTHDQRNGDADLATQYSYNVRSWLTDIKVGGDSSHGTLGETFTEKLYYQNQRPVNQQSTVQWGGNVSAMDWLAGSDSVERRYDFSYDGLSRLTGAGYAEDGVGSNDFSRGYAYDLNGNITSLATPSDTTQVTYAGNQLTGGNNYSYDANGNLTKDSVRGIDAISYNVLNLPSSITLGQSLPGGPGLTLDGRNYLYTSSGVKLQSIALFPLPLPGHTDLRERIDYVGNLVYDRTSLKKVLIDGGYVDMSGNSPEYRFFITDHLGNNRVVTDTTGTILQTNHYDPYGESLPIGAAVDGGNPYKYGGKEYDDKALAYDFGARYFTTSIPRWTTMDPLAEKYYSLSPYAYCAGNPMTVVDPNGLDTLYARTFGGGMKMIGENTENTGKKYIVRGATKRAVKRASKQMELYNGELPNNQAFVLPSSSMMEAIDNSLSKASASHLEQGGHVMVGSEVVYNWDPGVPPHSTIDENGRTGMSQSIRPFVVNGQSVEPIDASTLNAYWHIHATNTVDEYQFGSSDPSPSDIKEQKKLQGRKYGGYGIVVGERDSRVSFYNGERTLFRLKLKVLRAICK